MSQLPDGNRPMPNDWQLRGDFHLLPTTQRAQRAVVPFFRRSGRVVHNSKTATLQEIRLQLLHRLTERSGHLIEDCFGGLGGVGGLGDGAAYDKAAGAPVKG